MKESGNDFVVSRNIRLVPPFNENYVDGYFRQFEKVAISLNWPKTLWSIMLQSILCGKAQLVYSSLSRIVLTMRR